MEAAGFGEATVKLDIPLVIRGFISGCAELQGPKWQVISAAGTGPSSAVSGHWKSDIGKPEGACSGVVGGGHLGGDPQRLDLTLRAVTIAWFQPR